MAELDALGAEAAFTSIDLQDARACLSLIDASVERFGTVTALANAAALGARGTLADTSVELWDQIIATNARAPFFLMQGFVRHRQAQGGGGAIVNILSQCAHCGQACLAAYSAWEGALATLTKNVANVDRSDRIRCNAILPGWMDTPGEDVTQRRYHGATDGWPERAVAAQPMGQLCKPHELAGLASYLLGASNEIGGPTAPRARASRSDPGASASATRRRSFRPSRPQRKSRCMKKGSSACQVGSPRMSSRLRPESLTVSSVTVLDRQRRSWASSAWRMFVRPRSIHARRPAANRCHPRRGSTAGRDHPSSSLARSTILRSSVVQGPQTSAILSQSSPTPLALLEDALSLSW